MSPQADAPRDFTSVPIREAEANMVEDLRDWHEFLRYHRTHGHVREMYSEVARANYGGGNRQKVAYAIHLSLLLICAEHRNARRAL